MMQVHVDDQQAQGKAVICHATSNIVADWRGLVLTMNEMWMTMTPEADGLMRMARHEPMLAV